MIIFPLMLCLWLSSAEGLDIRLPPSIIKGPGATPEGPRKHKFYRVDDRIRLPCVATGMPKPEYEWYQDDRQLDFNNRLNVMFDSEEPGTGSIIITESYSLDEGYYQCRAENQYGCAVSEIVFLQRARMAPSSPPSHVATTYTATEGKPLMLPCSTVNSIPTATYSWVTTNDVMNTQATPVVLNKRVNMDGDGNLHFSYVAESDARGGDIYKCNAFNTLLDVSTGGSYSEITVNPSGDFKVQSPVIGYHTPTNVVAIKGSEQKLKCLFKARPKATVFWNRDTSDGLPNHHSVQSYGSELVINPVALDDEATYTCTGTNPHGEAAQDITVKVEAQPEFLTPGDGPRDLNATEGDTVTMNCITFAVPEARAEWFINGVLFDRTDKRSNNRYRIINNGNTLTISDVCKDCTDGDSDLQAIQCNASNLHGYVFSSGYINVLVPTTTVNRPYKTNVGYGEEKETLLNCLASSDDSTPITYTWQLDGNDVEYKPGVIWLTENNSLIIKAKDRDTAEKYAGKYTCIASNGYSSGEHSISVYVGNTSERLPAVWITVMSVIISYGCSGRFSRRHPHVLL